MQIGVFSMIPVEYGMDQKLNPMPGMDSRLHISGEVRQHSRIYCCRMFNY